MSDIHWWLDAHQCPHSNENVCPTCDFDNYYRNTYPDCPWRNQELS